MATATSAATTTPTAQQRQDVIAALQAVITAAEAELADPTTSRSVQAADRDIITTCEAEILRQQQALSQQSPVTYTVKSGDTIFSIAAVQLGDRLLYRTIQAANGLSFIALSPGQQLVMPAL